MSGSLFDSSGNRKYLVGSERKAFISAAMREEALVATFCITLAVAGARISEVLALSSERIDAANGAIVFKTLKQRGNVVFRAVPVPRSLIGKLKQLGKPEQERLWPWSRTTAWTM